MRLRIPIRGFVCLLVRPCHVFKKSLKLVVYSYHNIVKALEKAKKQIDTFLFVIDDISLLVFISFKVYNGGTANPTPIFNVQKGRIDIISIWRSLVELRRPRFRTQDDDDDDGG